VPSEHFAHRDVGQAVLLRAIDDLHVEPRAQAHAVEEDVPVGGLAHGAGGDGAIASDAVGVHDAPEALERLERGLERGRTNASVCEGVLA
jgi:hypothetical protein